MATRVAVFLSGEGRSLQNLIDRFHSPAHSGIEIVLVVASRDSAGGLMRAERAGITTAVVPAARTPVESYSTAMFDLVSQSQVDLVVLAGYLHLLRIPDAYRHRVMNIHPSLIPSFCGKGFHGARVHEAAIARGVKVSGCTVHFADNEYDHGPIVVQHVVPVLSDDTPVSLAERVFSAECEALPEAVQLFAEGRLRVDGERVFVTR